MSHEETRRWVESQSWYTYRGASESMREKARRMANQKTDARPVMGEREGQEREET